MAGFGVTTEDLELHHAMRLHVVALPNTMNDGS